ncbi:phosphopantetheine-binding protein [Streptomyces sp. BE308]|uniref:phosphopantetheine-binding protein n=1 Tax=unclassified Streptomyces TaxID=2593676 RepID=UPI002DDC0666|nr:MULTISPECIES: phosphopantetheine-binding protein [unclassified Streptomyces]MEE1796542.1 phosphopantetheine-binding protein [Streptomyces sp. BE308]WRZ78277.1 phosphopantetheine-binding protein [Streptomyces sp. NBC_01237]
MEADWPEEFETLVRGYLPRLRDEDRLHPDSDLINLGLDSLNAVGLLLDLEGAFDVMVPADGLNIRTVQSPSSLWSTIDELRKA